MNIAHTLPPDFYEKTLRNIANLRQEHEHDDTLHRFLGDAEAAIAHLIVLEAEATKEKGHLRADLEIVQGRLRSERDSTRADLKRAQETIYQERKRRVMEVEMFDRVLGTSPIEDTMTASKRVVKERDEARAERDRDLAAALEARNEIEDWRTRFDALATRAADLVKERDEARAKVEETKRDPAPFKVGDCIYNMATNEAGIVFGHFESIEGVRFVAVETKWGRSFFWSLDLVEAVKS